MWSSAFNIKINKDQHQPAQIGWTLAVPHQATAKCEPHICSLPPHLSDCCDYLRGLNALGFEAWTQLDNSYFEASKLVLPEEKTATLYEFLLIEWNNKLCHPREVLPFFPYSEAELDANARLKRMLHIWIQCITSQLSKMGVLMWEQGRQLNMAWVNTCPLKTHNLRAQ